MTKSKSHLLATADGLSVQLKRVTEGKVFEPLDSVDPATRWLVCEHAANMTATILNNPFGGEDEFTKALLS